MSSKSNPNQNPAAQKAPQAQTAAAPASSPQKANPAITPQPTANPKAAPLPMAELARKLLMFHRKEPVLDPQELAQASQDIKEEGQKSTSSEPEKLLGILALCALSGHDVHFLNAELKIDFHVPESEPLEGRLAEARQILNQRNDYLVAILVFENHFQFLNKNGEVMDNA
ncbi:MAG: hypothetical protein KF789_10190 [Bdellovibrionaceae bacterium]|nr:hypothetical protein [Pseudobdellovibrionaceae bacterium]